MRDLFFLIPSILKVELSTVSHPKYLSAYDPRPPISSLGFFLSTTEVLLRTLEFFFSVIIIDLL